MLEALKPGIDLIKEFETLRLVAYPDPIAGWHLPTIGYGTTFYPGGTNVKRGDVISATKAEECLMNHIQVDILPKLEKIPLWQKMNANQQSALLSFGYNIGPNFYGTKNHESITCLCDSPGQWNRKEWVAAQFVKYCNPGTPVEVGLRRRRAREAELFCTPVVEFM